MDNPVGFIGLGAIGEPMAEHVAKVHGAVVWNRTVAKAETFANRTGATAVQTAREVVERTKDVITCLPTSAQVLEVVQSVGDAWTDQHLLVDATSGDPAGSREVAAYLHRYGAGFVDAPVSGGTDGAKAGQLTVMLGGDEGWAARAMKVIDPYAGKMQHVGPVGAAHALKAVNNALLAVNIQAVGEGLAALVKLGVKADVALDVINASSGRSNVTENLFPKRVVTRAWPRTFRLALLDKDVDVAMKVLKETGVPSGAIRTAKEAFTAARQALGEEADHVEFVKEIEKAAGVEIR